jgi:DNA-binding response OmpR family regulator
VTRTTSGQAGATAYARLLVVDDEPAILTPIGEYFRGIGWEVFATDDPEVAEDELRRREYRAAVLDLALAEGRSGLELLAALRCQHPALPVAVLSAFVSPDVEGEVLRLGADAVLRKPLALPALAHVLTDIVAKRRANGAPISC